MVFNLRKLVAPSILLSIVFIVCLFNYVPNTYITGWDNLHPEFNFKTNIVDRSVFSVWQEYQGLGLLAVMGHASDLPRQLFLQLSVAFLPLSFIRYFYQFLMLLLGCIGVFLLLKKVVVREWLAFLGALFYLLNLGTVQNFYVPISMFTTFWGFFPLLLFLGINYLGKPLKRNLIRFLLASMLAVPMAYTPTIFIVYVFCFSVILVAVSFKHFKYLLRLLSVIFAVNAFWLFPFIYSTSRNVGTVINSTINQMSSENSFLLNKKWGGFEDAAILKGFWFGNVDLQIPQGKFDYMLRPWINHLQSGQIRIIGYILSAIVFLGFLTFITRFVLRKHHRDRVLLGFAGVMLASLFFLLNENPPLGFIFHWLRSKSPLFAEVFRFPFTKWVVPAALSYSVFFAVGVDVVSDGICRLLKRPFKILRLRRSSTVRWGVVGVVVIMLIIWAYPVFRGNLIYSNMRVQIPNDYFELFNFFKGRPTSERIANFPQYTFWGWDYYKWGYRGSGFLWYGIKQPILDRAFDVWNTKSEDYYKDISYALYSENSKLFYEVLNKYQINWVVVDENVIQPEGRLISLYTPKLEAILESSPKIALEREFGSIKVYRVVLNYFPSDYGYFSKSGGSYNVIRGVPSEIGAEIVRDSDGEGYALNLVEPLTFTKKGALEKYFSSENLVPAEVFAKVGKNFLYLKFSFKLPLFDGDDLQYTKKISVGSGEGDYILSVNSSQFIRLVNLDETYRSYGFALISTKTGNTINVYLGKAYQGETFSAGDFISKIHSCFDFNSDSVGSASLDGGGIKLSGRNSAPCFLLKSRFDGVREYNLVSISYKYKSKVGELPEFCILSDFSKGCLNNKFGNRPGFSREWGSYTDFVEIPKSVYNGDIFLEFALSAYKEGETIWYKDIVLKAYPLVFSGNVADVKDFLMSDYVGAGQKPMAVSSIKFGRSYFADKIDASLNKQSWYARNCDRFNRKYVDKEVEGESILYYSKDAVNCEDFELLTLPQAMGYIFSVDASNLKGLPFTFCLSNPKSKRCDISQRAVEGNNYLVQPAMSRNLSDLGYTLHLDSTSIGEGETVNKLNGIYVYYYPSLWIKSLFSVEGVGYKYGPNTAKITESRRYNPSLYKFFVKLPEGSNLFAFGQSFDKGWMAYDISGRKFLKGHTLVNSWANGWTVECEKSASCSKTIFVFYWPQILEFAGFAALLAYLLVMLRE